MKGPTEYEIMQIAKHAVRAGQERYKLRLARMAAKRRGVPFVEPRTGPELLKIIKPEPVVLRGANKRTLSQAATREEILAGLRRGDPVGVIARECGVDVQRVYYTKSQYKDRWMQTEAVVAVSGDQGTAKEV